jgi:undecaprenyl-diphosphatase
MNFFQAIILSIVEGITEFLPISSTGHMILATKVLSIPQTEFVKSFEIIIQFGAILAVVVLYWQRLVKDKKTWLPISFAFIPTMFIGLILYKIIKSYLIGNYLIVSLSLIVGGILIIILEKIYKSKKSHIDEIKKVPLKNSFLIGLGQSLAVIPGVSRSASTILTGLFVGLDRKTATEFSFLLAVPTMFAATVLDLTKSSWSFTTNEWQLLIVGFIGSMITAHVAVKWFLNFVQKNSFIPFAIYRIAAGILFLLFMGI